jgi:type II secretory pathway pseudopilin PulG
LVELLVVICLIGLLVSILLPGYAKVAGSAHVATCGANLKTIAAGLAQYANAHQGSYPLQPAATTTDWLNRYGMRGTDLRFLVNPCGVPLKAFICAGQKSPDPADVMNYDPGDGTAYTDDIPPAGNHVRSDYVYYGPVADATTPGSPALTQSPWTVSAPGRGLSRDTTGWSFTPAMKTGTGERFDRFSGNNNQTLYLRQSDYDKPPVLSDLTVRYGTGGQWLSATFNHGQAWDTAQVNNVFSDGGVVPHKASQTPASQDTGSPIDTETFFLKRSTSSSGDFIYYR